LPSLAGLDEGEERAARELFDSVTVELGLGVELPRDRTAARWALAYWLAQQVAEGRLDPAAGADRIWGEAAVDLDYPEELREIVTYAIQLADWDESWGTPWQDLKDGALHAARQLVERRAANPGA
ncbi:hypothetical protein, partial [Streptomyces hainanensis]